MDTAGLKADRLLFWQILRHSSVVMQPKLKPA